MGDRNDTAFILTMTSKDNWSARDTFDLIQVELTRERGRVCQIERVTLTKAGSLLRVIASMLSVIWRLSAMLRADSTTLRL